MADTIYKGIQAQPVDVLSYVELVVQRGDVRPGKGYAGTGAPGHRARRQVDALGELNLAVLRPAANAGARVHMKYADSQAVFVKHVSFSCENPSTPLNLRRVHLGH